MYVHSLSSDVHCARRYILVQCKCSHVSCSSCADVVVTSFVGVDNDGISDVPRIESRPPAGPSPSTWVFLFRRLVFKELDRAGCQTRARLHRDFVGDTMDTLRKQK